MKLYPYARANEHGHAVALFSSSPSKRSAAYRKPCAVDRAEDLDALLAAAWGGCSAWSYPSTAQRSPGSAWMPTPR